MTAVRSKTKLRRCARQAGLGAWLDTMEMVEQSPQPYRDQLLSALEDRAVTHARAMFPLMVGLTGKERRKFGSYLKEQAAHVAVSEARAYLRRPIGHQPVMNSASGV